MANTIRARAQVDGKGVATVRFVIQHPMLIDRTDPKTGAALPAHFIEEVRVILGSEPLLTADWGQAVSANPFFQFSYSGARAGDELTISWRDNRGQNDTTKFTVS